MRISLSTCELGGKNGGMTIYTTIDSKRKKSVKSFLGSKETSLLYRKGYEKQFVPPGTHLFSGPNYGSAVITTYSAIIYSHLI